MCVAAIVAGLATLAPQAPGSAFCSRGDLERLCDGGMHGSTDGDLLDVGELFCAEEAAYELGCTVPCCELGCTVPCCAAELRAHPNPVQAEVLARQAGCVICV